MPKTETKAPKTSDAVEILDRMMAGDTALRQEADEALVNAEVAQLIYDARTKSKLTQKQLAELVGTTQSVIARLEDADYEGHSLSMLQRTERDQGPRLNRAKVSPGRGEAKAKLSNGTQWVYWNPTRKGWPPPEASFA